MSTKWRELFPTKLTFAIFMLYMSLFVGQGIFVTASQEANNSYSYNTVTAVLLTELLKLVVSSCLYCKDNSLVALIRDIRKDFDVLLLYGVPALLYCIYNNLAFVNLSTFDPTTYYLLLQLRVVITGVLFQVIFKKYLTRMQWLSLLLLTLGCMLKEIEFGNPFADNEPTPTQSTHGKNMSGFDLSFSALFILIQTVCSCLAGVYNEYLLKDKGANVNIFVQNVFMYIDSIICNVGVLLLRGQLLEAFSGASLTAFARFDVALIIVNNCAIGIVTSFFLKYMNSILKTFASALELLFTAVLSYLLFAIPIYVNTILAIAVVSFAIYLYSQSPVVNAGKTRVSQHENALAAKSSLDRRALLYDIEDDDSDDLEMDMV